MKKGIFLLLAFSLFMNAVDAQKKPLIVFVAGDHEYGGEQTLPLLAAELEKSYNFQTKVLTSFPNQNGEKNIPGLEALKNADLAVFYLRWRQLVPEQLALIEEYLKTGKPVMGFRTTTHAFNFPKNHPSASRRRHTRWTTVTGVQTCALPINDTATTEIGRASCRERV